MLGALSSTTPPTYQGNLREWIRAERTTTGARSKQVPGAITMPRSIQEILDHADELAKRFEDYDPQPDDERPVEEYLIQRAAIARARSERQIVEAVTAARTKGLSWQRIGELLGTSAQAAQQRYGRLVESV